MIIINKNKNYFKTILVIVLILCALYFLGFKFLQYPSEHTYFLLPTKNSVIIFSIFGILGCLLAMYLILKTIFRRNALLKIDNSGILNGFAFYNKKFIKWEEVAKIESITYNDNKYIGIFLKDPQNTEKGINYFLYKMNESSMGTAHIISSADLDCSFEDLKKNIFEYWEKYKY
ncbi:STM3941 family protein [Chryseobacterium sp. NFX27]|uniref:STM3941 family protein n=1 Tax=Chryseobacterium sp. NFX27 TaxID=2819618 RepID=UPI003CF56C58